MNQSFFIIGGLIVLLVILLLLRLRRRHSFSERDVSVVRSEWKSVQDKIAREPKYALMEGDKLLDFVLKKRGYEGSMSDKLKQAAREFSHVDDIWKAHTLRNRAVHEVGFTLHEEQVRRSLSHIKQAIFELGVPL